MTGRQPHQTVLIVLLAAVLLAPASLRAQTSSQTPAATDTAGAACAPNGALSYNGNSFVVCTSGVWGVEPVTIGTQTASCASSLAGQIQWNGSALQYCTGSSWTTVASGVAGSGTTNYLARWTPNGTTLGIGATYDNGTSVGIGTTGPRTALDAWTGTITAAQYNVGASRIAATNLSNGTTGSGSVVLSASPTLTGTVGIGGTDTGVNFFVNGDAYIYGGSSYAYLNNSGIGVIGYGTNSGTNGMMGENTSTGYLCYLGTPSSSIVCSGPTSGVSDQRLKKDIHPLEVADGLDALMKIQPVQYHWKDERMNKKGRYEIGFIAQNVEKVLPELVDEVAQPPDAVVQLPGLKSKALEYDRLIAPAILAIQQLKARFDDNRDEIEKLKAGNDKLRAANDNEAAQIKTLSARLDVLEAVRR